MQKEQKGKNIGNYFGATPDRPYHLSVGIVVLDQDSNIICLHYPKIDHYTDVYALPNKTVRPNETLEEAAMRGSKSELVANIEILAYLGNIVVNDTWFGELGTPKPVEKNVVYFLAKEISTDETIAAEENEKEKRSIVHKTFDFLIDAMSKQEVKDGMRDFAQAEIVIRAKKWLETA